MVAPAVLVRANVEYGVMIETACEIAQMNCRKLSLPAVSFTGRCRKLRITSDES